MPYRLQKSGRKYYVVTKGTNKRHSKRPMSKTMAQRQMRAIYANSNQRGLRHTRMHGGGASYLGYCSGRSYNDWWHGVKCERIRNRETMAELAKQLK